MRVLSQIKDIYHIERDVYAVAWVIPQGRDLGVLGYQEFSFSEQSHVAYQIEGGGE